MGALRHLASIMDLTTANLSPPSPPLLSSSSSSFAPPNSPEDRKSEVARTLLFGGENPEQVDFRLEQLDGSILVVTGLIIEARYGIPLKCKIFVIGNDETTALALNNVNFSASHDIVLGNKKAIIRGSLITIALVRKPPSSKFIDVEFAVSEVLEIAKDEFAGRILDLGE